MWGFALLSGFWANQYGLNGDVNNDGQGVLIRFVSPPADALEQFLSDLQNKLPPLAQITDITQRAIGWPEANCNNKALLSEKAKTIKWTRKLFPMQQPVHIV